MQEHFKDNTFVNYRQIAILKVLEYCFSQSSQSQSQVNNMNKFSIDASPLGASKPIHVDDAGRAINYLQGKVLTVIEALDLPINQEKAIKDILKGYVSDCHMTLYGIAFPDTKMMTEVEAEITGAVDESIIQETVSFETK